jgi:addiction module RelB/DinJ family antitoxin
MNTAVINIKTDRVVKVQAKKVASDMGLSLSSIINAYLRQLVRTRRIEIDLNTIPVSKELRYMREGEEALKKGKMYTDPRKLLADATR